MAEYFSTRKDAEEAIRRWGKVVVFFAKILDGREEKWMVDFRVKDYGNAIKIVENLSREIPSIIGG